MKNMLKKVNLNNVKTGLTIAEVIISVANLIVTTRETLKMIKKSKENVSENIKTSTGDTQFAELTEKNIVK